MHRHVLRTVLAIALTGAALSSAPAAADDLAGRVLVFAAASTTDAIEQIKVDFARAHPHVELRTSYAASSALAKQITAGAAADVFLCASPEWADYLARHKKLARQHPLLSNELVIVVPTDSKLAIAAPADLAESKVAHLALADPASVPAGIYARQALERLELWSKVAKRVAGAADVRQALQFVATGAAEAGIVYATDAAATKDVRVVARIDPQLTDPIRYPLVLTPHGAANPAAVAFDAYLQSPAAAAVFRKLGFVVLPPADAGK